MPIPLTPVGRFAPRLACGGICAVLSALVAAVCGAVPAFRAPVWIPRTQAATTRRQTVNEALAKRDFAGRDPIGQRFHLSDTTFATIVGVVTDVRNAGPISDPQPEMYWNYLQSAPGAATVSLMIRVSGTDPTTVVPGVRAAVRGIRTALGSPRGMLVRLFAMEGLKLVVAGVVLGLAGGAVVTRLMTFMLYGTSPLDPLSWTGRRHSWYWLPWRQRSFQHYEPRASTRLSRFKSSDHSATPRAASSSRVPRWCEEGGDQVGSLMPLTRFARELFSSSRC